MEMRFGMIGGDRRQAELARLLAADGNSICTYGLNTWNPGGESSLRNASMAEVIILPLPLCKHEGVLNCEQENISTQQLFRCLKPAKTLRLFLTNFLNRNSIL